MVTRTGVTAWRQTLPPLVLVSVFSPCPLLLWNFQSPPPLTWSHEIWNNFRTSVFLVTRQTKRVDWVLFPLFSCICKWGSFSEWKQATLFHKVFTWSYMGCPQFVFLKDSFMFGKVVRSWGSVALAGYRPRWHWGIFRARADFVLQLIFPPKFID